MPLGTEIRNNISKFSSNDDEIKHYLRKQLRDKKVDALDILDYIRDQSKRSCTISAGNS
jgi:hypothetical protein